MPVTSKNMEGFLECQCSDSKMVDLLPNHVNSENVEHKAPITIGRDSQEQCNEPIPTKGYRMISSNESKANSIRLNVMREIENFSKNIAQLQNAGFWKDALILKTATEKLYTSANKQFSTEKGEDSDVTYLKLALAEQSHRRQILESQKAALEELLHETLDISEEGIYLCDSCEEIVEHIESRIYHQSQVTKNINSIEFPDHVNAHKEARFCMKTEELTYGQPLHCHSNNEASLTKLDIDDGNSSSGQRNSNMKNTCGKTPDFIKWMRQLKETGEISQLECKATTVARFNLEENDICCKQEEDLQVTPIFKLELESEDGEDS